MTTSLLTALNQPTGVLANAADRLARQTVIYQRGALTQPMIDAMRANADIIRAEIKKIDVILFELKEVP